MYCKNCGESLNDQSVCPKCGAPAGNGNAYCATCGKEIPEGATFCVNCGAQLEPTVISKKSNPNTQGIEKRSIVLAIVLSFVTCGIYSIYWFISLTNEMNQASGRNDTSGVKAFLFNLITCGIYGLYWAYKMGEKRDVVAGENASSNIIYLILTILGVGIVVDILCQDTLNKAIDNR